jgi:DNA-directed RNA polymerase, sigma subunit (sigma70/sigma32)
MLETLSRVRTVQSELFEQLRREPTVDEVAEACGIAPDRVGEAVRAMTEPVSLHVPIGDEDTELGDLLPDVEGVSPFEAAAMILRQQELWRILGALAERERRVLSLRFGLLDGEPRTLEEVGRELGLTRERIRQIEAKALCKLRHPTTPAKLRDLVSI